MREVGGDFVIGEDCGLGLEDLVVEGSAKMHPKRRGEGEEVEGTDLHDLVETEDVRIFRSLDSDRLL